MIQHRFTMGHRIFHIWLCAILAAVMVWPVQNAVQADSALDPANLPDGTYSVKATIYNYTMYEKSKGAKNQLSMADNAFVKTIRVTVKNGNYTAGVCFHGMTINWFGTPRMGYLKWLKYWNGKAYKNVTVKDRYNVYDDYNDTNHNNKPEFKYPKRMTFPLVNKNKGDKYGCVRIQVFVPIMESISTGTGTQEALLKLDWSSLKKGTAAAEKAETAYFKKNPVKLNGHTGSSARKSNKKTTKQKSTGKKTAKKTSSKKNSTKTTKTKKLKISRLSDGTYAIKGEMVKVDRTTHSMSNDAINHTIKLTVKNGNYRLTMHFFGLNINGKKGYLGKLRYFQSGYRKKASGAPKGNTASARVLSYQMSGGKRLRDTFGTNYPKQVSVPMIKEAKKDGYVPLQVFVPIMESISAGTGTQPVYLHLRLSTLKRAGASTDFDSQDSDGNGCITGSGGGYVQQRIQGKRHLETL